MTHKFLTIKPPSWTEWGGLNDIENWVGSTWQVNVCYTQLLTYREMFSNYKIPWYLLCRLLHPLPTSHFFAYRAVLCTCYLQIYSIFDKIKYVCNCKGVFSVIANVPINCHHMCLVTLLLNWWVFYSPSTHFRSFRVRSVNLATLFLGSLPVLSDHSFANNWQLPFLNQRKGDNGCRMFFVTKSQRTNVAGPGLEPATLWFAVRLAPACTRRPGEVTVKVYAQ